VTLLGTTSQCWRRLLTTLQYSTACAPGSGGAQCTRMLGVRELITRHAERVDCDLAPPSTSTGLVILNDVTHTIDNRHPTLRTTPPPIPWSTETHVVSRRHPANNNMLARGLQKPVGCAEAHITTVWNAGNAPKLRTAHAQNPAGSCWVTHSYLLRLQKAAGCPAAQMGYQIARNPLCADHCGSLSLWAYKHRDG